MLIEWAPKLFINTDHITSLHQNDTKIVVGLGDKQRRIELSSPEAANQHLKDLVNKVNQSRLNLQTKIDELERKIARQQTAIESLNDMIMYAPGGPYAKEAAERFSNHVDELEVHQI